MRPAVAADAPALARLGRDSFIAAFGHLYARRDLDAFLAAAYAEPAVRAEIASPERLHRLAERGGRLVAFCKLKLVSGFADHGTAERAIDLAQLYCAPGETGQGTGAALMDWALAEARSRGADELRLSVWAGNLAAQRFYARYGFVKIDDVDFRVGDHVDEEFLYALRL